MREIDKVLLIGSDNALNLNKQEKVETAFGSEDIEKVRNSSRVHRVGSIIKGLNSSIPQT